MAPALGLLNKAVCPRVAQVAPQWQRGPNCSAGTGSEIVYNYHDQVLVTEQKTGLNCAGIQPEEYYVPGFPVQ